MSITPGVPLRYELRNTNYDKMLRDILNHVQDPVVLKGLAQVGTATVLAVLVVLLSWRRGLELESELSVAFVRGFVQVVAVGLVIGVLLTVPVA